MLAIKAWRLTDVITEGLHDRAGLRFFKVAMPIGQGRTDLEVERFRVLEVDQQPSSVAL
jgi:hypothetical protein